MAYYIMNAYPRIKFLCYLLENAAIASEENEAAACSSSLQMNHPIGVRALQYDFS